MNKLIVSTENLRKILADNPEIELELASMASEKIAEELKRKALGMADAYISKRVKDIFDRELRRFESKWSLPKKAMENIGEHARTACSTYLNKEVPASCSRLTRHSEELQADAVKHLQTALDKKFDKMRDELKETVDQQARESFFAVLKEAKGVNK